MYCTTPSLSKIHKLVLTSFFSRNFLLSQLIFFGLGTYFTSGRYKSEKDTTDKKD